MPRKGDPSRRFAAAHKELVTAAVTGTNGKTSTVSMIAAIVAASGELSARLTTLGAWVGDRKIEQRDATREFLATVELSVRERVKTLALEVTSKALAGGLARRWPADCAVFTNLSRDHMDMHGTAESYLAAKAQLFIHVRDGGAVVLNRDDECAPLIDEIAAPSARRFWYSVRDPAVDLAATAVDVSREGTRLQLAPGPLADALGGELRIRLIGYVFAKNALAAALAAHALGYGPDAIAGGLLAFPGVSGRFEVVAREPFVVVDYAHTPDGLETTLAAARELVADGGELVCVFGCGGDRDRGKRPQMGAIADRLADRVVLTSDNPRHEAPEAIAADIEAGAPERASRWVRELDRPAAVRRAVEEAGPADVVVVAGKGHEAVQEIAGATIEMSDATLVRAAIASVAAGGV